MGTTTTTRTRSWWGWGYEDQAVGRDEMLATAGRLAERFGRDVETIDPPRVADLDLRAPTRLAPARRTLAGLLLIRALRPGRPHLRQIVPRRRTGLPGRPTIRPTSWRSRDRGRSRRPARLVLEARVAAIPYGGGSSVSAASSATWARLRRRRFDRPRPARPRPRWTRLARRTRPGGRPRARPRGPAPAPRPHPAPLSTVVRVLDSRRLAGHPLRRPLRHAVHPHRRPRRVATGRHAAGVTRPAGLPARRGPSPDRLFLGSEGIGVITEAWMRVQDRPRWRVSATARFPNFARRGRGPGRRPGRALADQLPAARRGRGGAAGRSDGSAVLLVLGFESADDPLGAWIARAVELCGDHRRFGAGWHPHPPTGSEAQHVERGRFRRGVASFILPKGALLRDALVARMHPRRSRRRAPGTPSTRCTPAQPRGKTPCRGCAAGAR